MNYEFPKIETIDDVLPHIEGRDEFIVAKREFGSVINYNVVKPDTFPDVNTETDKIRRECRGLIFDNEGRISSRPFHKFFNIGEREETQPYKLDFKKGHIILEKMDGSMIRPVLYGGRVRLATKMGFTDIAEDAEKWLYDQYDAHSKLEWLEFFERNDLTPIFEWISPENKIVVDYDKKDLVLLAIRHNLTGEYLPIEGHNSQDAFTAVEAKGRSNNVESYLKETRNETNREGDVIRFFNGHMVKSKNDWYVRLHKTMDKIRFDRHVIDLILNEELDDLIPMLPVEEKERCKGLEKNLWENVERKTKALKEAFEEAKQFETRKEVAVDFIPKLNDKTLASFIFKLLDEKGTPESLVLEHVSKNLNSNTQYEILNGWLNQ